MENNLQSGKPVERNDAAFLLDSLQADRAGLAERLQEPKWFTPALGALAAVFIATPALPESLNQGSMLTSLVILSVLLILAYQRATGIKTRGFGLRESALFGVALVATLFFFSISLGLAASGLSWWVLAPTIIGFLTATGLARLAASSMWGRVSNAA